LYFGPEAIQDNFRPLVIILDHYDIEIQKRYVERQKQLHPDKFAYITAFTIQGWDEPNWIEKTIAGLKKDFENGAIGVKVWKNIGMEFRSKNGNFIKIDHPKFDPIIDFIASQNKTLTGHIGEPRDCWLPIEKMVSPSNRRYYQSHPEYHMYLHPDYPSYEELIQSYDNMLQKHPNIRYVGCHLGSIEWNVEELGKMLDKHPNMAVDLAARIDDIQLLDQKKVREFFIKYQDRILYGTDLGISEDADPQAFIQRMHEIWKNDWRYFATDSLATIRGSDLQIKGLHLPEKVLRKIYFENAKKWYPGIL